MVENAFIVYTPEINRRVRPWLEIGALQKNAYLSSGASAGEAGSGEIKPRLVRSLVNIPGD